jgi:hypothetical protein
MAYMHALVRVYLRICGALLYTTLSRRAEPALCVSSVWPVHTGDSCPGEFSNKPHKQGKMQLYVPYRLRKAKGTVMVLGVDTQAGYMQ